MSDHSVALSLTVTILLAASQKLITSVDGFGKWRLRTLRLWLWLLNSCGKCCCVEVGCWLEVEVDSSQAVVVVIKQLWQMLLG